MDNTIRIGYVSSINYEAGMIRVTYPDKDGATTAEFPCFSAGGEYQMPVVKDQVIVLHLSNDTSSGVVLGKVWNEDNRPPLQGEKSYYKQLGSMAHEQVTGADYTLSADTISFSGSTGSITVEELLDMKRRLEELEART